VKLQESVRAAMTGGESLEANRIQVERLKQSLDKEKKSRKNDGTLDGGRETMELVNVKTPLSKKKKDTTMTGTGMDKSGLAVATTYDGKTQMVRALYAFSSILQVVFCIQQFGNQYQFWLD